MADNRLDTLDCQIINRMQRGMPICSQPYQAIADELGISEPRLLARLHALLADGVLTRIGPMYQIEKMGGRFCLAAMAVPTSDFDRIAAIVNAFPEVAHNYQRDHHLNMWFVVACASPQALFDTIERLKAATGLHVYAMPKEKEFFVNLYLPA
ncbi:AsnC family transcriptional regulator [Chitinivorax sp. B]|uniref:AsnC family transcriptional regulator n=1 Tax=Chitinivorax sp. B TaxID=2502235 RepID=UPI0010F79307|nr:AsnC family transcriptional regulator [Chitinivorax sp. B]